MREFKLNETVFNIRFGLGKCSNINSEDIWVKFDSCSSPISFDKLNETSGEKNYLKNLFHSAQEASVYFASLDKKLSFQFIIDNCKRNKTIFTSEGDISDKLFIGWSSDNLLVVECEKLLSKWTESQIRIANWKTKEQND
jgi:hypothetical protein